MNHFSISFSKILSYVPCSMLRIVSKLVKSTPWVLLRSWVDIGFDNWFWCTDSCTNWFALAIFRHIQAKNHNLQFRKMCFIVNLFSPLIFYVTFTKFLPKIVGVNFRNFHSVRLVGDRVFNLSYPYFWPLSNFYINIDQFPGGWLPIREVCAHRGLAQ